MIADWQLIEPRKAVRVLVEDTWYPGELRAWGRDEDGSWWGWLTVTVDVGKTYIRQVPADRVRPA